MPEFLIAAFMDADEQYAAYVFTPAGTFMAASGSIGLLAEVAEDQCRTIEGYAEFGVKYEWLGLLADVSESHVRACLEPVDAELN